MSNANEPSAPTAALGELQTIVDTCGGDRTRWPAAGRLRLAPVIASDKRAREIVAQAHALDRLLDLAPTVPDSRERALASRILAATRPGLPVASGASSASAVARASVPSVLAARTQAKAMARWPAGALLAASLVLGVLVGSSGIATPAVSYIADALGLADEEPELAQLSDVSMNGEDT